MQLLYHIIQNSLAIYWQFNINENFKYLKNVDLIYNLNLKISILYTTHVLVKAYIRAQIHEHKEHLK